MIDGVGEGDGGLATVASLDTPYGRVMDFDGNLFFAELNNGMVRRIDARTAEISTVYPQS